MIRILMLEDNIADARLVEYDLKSSTDESFEICHVERLEDAKKKLARERFEIILADLNLPDSKGMDSFQTLTEAAPSLPIVLLTGNNDEELAGRLVREGAEDYIVKGEVKGRYLVRAIHYAIERRALRTKLQVQNRKLEQMLQIDPLTGLFSRRHILSYLDDEIARHNRYGNDLSLILIDIDDFKHINDDYGHNAGDQALKAIAEHIRANVRKVDKPARYGGDEFIVLLPDSDVEAAEKVCMKLISEPVSARMNDDTEIELSISIGAAEAHGISTSTRLIDASDMAMFVAKKSGKGKYHVLVDDEKTRDGHPIDLLNESRNSLREVLCQLLGAALNEAERARDIIDSVSEISQLFAERLLRTLNLPHEQVRTLKNTLQVVRFVDLNMPVEMLSATGELEDVQRKVFADRFSYNIGLLRKIRFLREEVEILADLHEQYDGTGFPRGLSGENLPLLSKIAKPLLDSALMFKSSRKGTARTLAEILGHLTKGAGSLYDPEIAPKLSESLEVMQEEYVRTGDGHVLLIEDDKINISVMKHMLEQENFTVTTAMNAEEFYRVRDERKWAVALVDNILPDGSGFDIIRELNGMEKRPVICVLSTSIDRGSIHRAEKEGADLYLIKPVKIRLLLRFLAVRGLQREGTRKMPVISGLSTIGDLR